MKRISIPWILIGLALGGYLLGEKSFSSAKIKIFFTDPLSFGKGEEVVDELIHLIDSATHTIDLAIYGFGEKKILNSLIRAHRRGVKIRVVTDEESFKNPYYAPTFRAMQRMGISLRFNPERIPGSMHHKFIIFDGRRVLTGSCNFTDRGFDANSNDLILVESPQLAHAYTREFEEMFIKDRWGREKRDNNREIFNLNEGRIELYISPSDEVERRLIELIRGAKESIYLAMFYLTNDRLYHEIMSAIKRGVNVKALLDERGASNNHSEALRLVELGNGWIDALAGLLHHKFLIIDPISPNAILVTGSANWSRSGMHYNDENILILHHPPSAKLYFAYWKKLYEDAVIIYPYTAEKTPPGAPRVTVHHYNRQPGRARVEWNFSQIKATAYKVYRAYKSGGPYKLLATISKAEAMKSADYEKCEESDGIEGSYYAHYLDFDVVPGRTYYYVVTTLVGWEESPYSNEYYEKVLH